ncbi:hypothetical protein EV200_105287 [Pedobacter psychrotolerans]|nr:hypothetical protein [Pedobacter psychrotolerans]TCO23813.1 hypothetical protein EV200_105287 [Pedobacter psychrotolerans]
MLFVTFANSESLLAIAGILTIILSFVLLGKYTLLLREDVENDDGFIRPDSINLSKSPKNITSPYSLEKVQLGLWTVVISCSYLYLSLFKGDCSETEINQTALVLLGIFSCTAVTSKIIDKREIKDQRPRHQNTPSLGFFTDILSDDLGISIHRFQHVVWTMVGVSIYLYKIGEIKTGCGLPELSDTLLMLMGISSAIFVAIRSRENEAEGTPKTGVPNYTPAAAPAPAIHPYQPPAAVQTPPVHTSSGGNAFYG